MAEMQTCVGCHQQKYPESFWSDNENNECMSCVSVKRTCAKIIRYCCEFSQIKEYTLFMGCVISSIICNKKW